MSNDTYNGWHNRQTWRVQIEIFDECKASDFFAGVFTVWNLEQALSRYVHEIVYANASGLALEYALDFLEYVNWRELAERMMPDPEPEDEDEEGDGYIPDPNDIYGMQDIVEDN